MKPFKLFFLAVTVLSLYGCTGSPFRPIKEGEVIGNQYASFVNPGTTWKITKKYGKNYHAIPNIYSDPKGANFTIDFQTWPFKWKPWDGYFEKTSVYKSVLKDTEMKFGEIEKEQGVGYVRQWVNYVLGMKCSEGVFSRNHGGLLKDISSKNYSLTCGYYDNKEGKRLIRVSYRYNYAGGEIRHQKDKNMPQDELLSLEQAELQLKQAVKQLISTIKIKNFDRERMERDGLIHYDKPYEISPF